MRSPFGLLVALAIASSVGAVGCSTPPLTQEECDHLLGRGIAFIAFPNDAVPALDVENVKGRARGPVKSAIAAFDKACVGSKGDDVVLCQRRAKSLAELDDCGPIPKLAHQTALLAQLAVARRHTTEECATYAEHGVKIGAGTADDAGRFHQECDGWMEVGVYQCRLASKDKPAWAACDADR